MNRIRELREMAGLTVDELAARANTSSPQIRRLETGARRLTVDWMNRIAHALECSPTDLLVHAVISQAVDEVEVAPVGLGSLDAAIKRRGLAVYKVLADSVSETGIDVGHLIAVDHSSLAISSVQSLDVVIVQMSAPSILVLRQFVRPCLMITNRKGHNLAVRMDDPSVPMTIAGVVVTA